MKLVIVALVLISSAISSNGQYEFYDSEVAAMQAIFRAWNQSTPNVAANLPGWNDNTYEFPCFAYEPWKGVLCLQYVNPNSPTFSSPNSSTNVVVVVGF
jgi:hypothetical protein